MKLRFFSILCVVVLVASDAVRAQNSYRQELLAWRQQRERNLQGDNGWLTVAGLVFLKPGKNTFGADRADNIVLPRGSDGGSGVLDFDRGRVHLVSKTPVAINGISTTSGDIRPAADNRPADVVTLGSVSFFLMTSGDRVAVRVRDQHNALRTSFAGLTWFPPNELWKLAARFEPYPSPKPMKVLNILGDLDPFVASGLLAFARAGKTYKLEVYDLGTGSEPLFIVFKDLTSGGETYPAARFLNAPRPNAKGETVLDFNKAYNPPCAYNPYTTCPLPTAQNRLNVRVEAGELDYHRQH